MRKSDKYKTIRYLCGLLLVSLVFFYSCEKYTYDPPALDPDKIISFATDITPVFEGKCISCHGGSLPPNLSTGKAYTTLTTKGYISSDPTNTPETSKIYTKLEKGHAPDITALELQMILQWIRQGAKNN